MGSTPGNLRVVNLPDWLKDVEAVFFTLITANKNVIDVYQHNPDPDTKIISFPWKGVKDGDNQTYILTKDGIGGSWRLKCKFSGQYLTVKGDAPLTQATGDFGDPSADNSWEFYTQDGQDPWTFWIGKPNSNLFLDVKDGKVEPETPIIQYPFNQPVSKNQQWQMRFPFQL